MKRESPRIAVTMGDPAGIGPEIALRLLAAASTEGLGEPCRLVLFADAGVLRRVATSLALPFDAHVVPFAARRAALADGDDPLVVDLAAMDADALRPGVIDAGCGEAAYRYIASAIDAAIAGEVDAVVTGPIHKEALHAAGHLYPGHTEIFAERFGAERVCMMLTAGSITCSLVTTHVGLREVADLLTVQGVLDAIELTADAMRRIRGREPRLVVCGLNPHAGEGGLFGAQEEERILLPAIEAARAKGIAIAGPLPADTAFLPAKRAVTDAYVCMYHDQGLIPLKALAFEDAVNVTLGLPIVRTSVDHGTAFDIAWKGVADPRSLFEAVRLAVRLCEPARDAAT